MKNITKIFVALTFAWLAVGCHQEDLFEPLPTTQVGVVGDEMRLSLGVNAPDPVEVVTRGVDPDGKALQTLTVFCFDRNGLLISTSAAKVKPKAGIEDNTEGTIDVSIPVATRIMHLVGNQNMSRFDKNTFTNKSEDEVLSILEGSAGMLIYWARIEVPTDVNTLYTNAKYELNDGTVVTATEAKRTEPEAIVDWLTIETNPTTEKHRGIEGKGQPIILLRNQARFGIVSIGHEEGGDEWKGTFFEVTGFAVCNTPAFGTVAPYHYDKGFPTYAYSDFTPYYGVSDWLADNSVTLPARRDKLTDANDVSNAHDQFIFETTNDSTDPVDLILRGYNIVNGERETVERYYYRVNLMDEEGEMITIRRNHHYVINIDDNLTNGCLTFEEALRSPATNNIWISISDEVNAVRDDKVELSVEKTKHITDAAILEDFSSRLLPLNFNVNKLKDDVELKAEKLTVRWIEDNQQVSSTQNPSLVIGDAVTFDTTTGEGAITIQLMELPEGEQMVKGTLLVKYGRLQRKIRVLTVRDQQFVPAWVSSEVYGKLTGDNFKGENVTVIFNIPETCPEELFPIKVLVTTNGLDGRAASGQVLPIVKKGEDGYGEEFEMTVNLGTEDEKTLTDLGYKYEYTVTASGQHRIYFRNIFEVEQGAVEYVVLQADHFQTIAKPVTYVDHQNKILLPFLAEFSATDTNMDEPIKYVLVPQKRFAPVIFDIGLEYSGTTPEGTPVNEEFLLYSSNIDHYPDDDARLDDNEFEIKSDMFDCYFKPYDESVWGTGGRIYGFYPRNKDNGFWDTKIDKNEDPHKVFQIYLETNKPKSAEVVRIASNQKGSPQVKNQNQLYDGVTFRSVTFELANYRPFRFAAQVRAESDFFKENDQYVFKGNYKIDPDDNSSSNTEPELIDNIEFSYLPDQIVEVAFDITSFKAHDGTSVSPFGTGFEVFIDAPMLTLVKGMNKTNDSFKDDFEEIKVSMFDKDIDGNHVTTDKPKLEDLGNGRFVYRVENKSFYEHQYWSGTQPLIPDETLDLNDGSRVSIKFKKNSIVSDGEITVSANPEHITYHSKTFKVSNQPIQGRIGYKPAADQDPIPVPASQFVSFSRVYDDSRIGSLIVKSINELTPGAPTYYELRLRGEYEFRWTDDPIKIQTQIGGEYYSTIIPDIKTLFDNPDIILEKDTNE